MVVMMAGIHISQEIFAIDVSRALKTSLEQRRKHVLQLLQLYGDQATMYCHFDDRSIQFNSISISRKVDGIGLSMDAGLALYS